jgi:hypothetical protein
MIAADLKDKGITRAAKISTAPQRATPHNPVKAPLV